MWALLVHFVASVGPQGHRGGKGSGEVIPTSNLAQAPGAARFQRFGAEKLPNFRRERTLGGPRTHRKGIGSGSALLLPKRRDRILFLQRSAGTTSAHTQDGHQRRRALGELRPWEGRSLRGSRTSSPRVPIPPGLEEARPAGVLPHLRCCARALRARKSLRGGRRKGYMN